MARAARLGDRALRSGARGGDVRQLQQALIKAGFDVTVDGHLGPATVDAVKRFQRAARLQPSGTVGRLTVRRLRSALRGTTAYVNGGFDAASSVQRHQSLGDRIPIGPGMSGHDIRVLQDFLGKAGFAVKIDGQYGSATVTAVQAFETKAGRSVNGTMDAADMDALRTMIGQPDPAGTAPAPAPLALTPGQRATVGPDGLAIAPADAPDVVKAIIAAGNQIATKPYRYGGGHGKFDDTGYDCSGSVSFALHGAGLLASPLASGDFFGWGDSGPGQWVTIYTKSSHMFMVVAGLRFDTSGRSTAGTRWQADMRSGAGYQVLHPPGL
jgi:peptidoglycan hydrolase-like protein with peptidoglycan-binding domain